MFIGFYKVLLKNLNRYQRCIDVSKISSTLNSNKFYVSPFLDLKSNHFSIYFNLIGGEFKKMFQKFWADRNKNVRDYKKLVEKYFYLLSTKVYLYIFKKIVYFVLLWYLCVYKIKWPISSFVGLTSRVSSWRPWRWKCKSFQTGLKFPVV